MSQSNPRLIEAFRRAGWLPSSDEKIKIWLNSVVSEVNAPTRANLPLHPLVQKFQNFIEENPTVYMGFHQMFEEQKTLMTIDPPPVKDYKTLCRIFDKIIKEAPYYGDLGPPVYMVLNQCMNTRGGFSTFLNAELNAQFKSMFGSWQEMLNSPQSCHVLTDGPGGWFSSPALKALENDFGGLSFEQIYECQPDAPNWGYKSWDDFFNRKFSTANNVRPLEALHNPNIINGACESALYNIAKDVQERDSFWLKGQPYSLMDLLNNDEYAPQFAGGTIIQGFLQVTGYHRWNSPVAGKVKKIVSVPGTYFCQSPTTIQEAFEHPYLESLSFVTSVATRMLIFLESDNPLIGLMCFIACGMTEISTCEATVREGDRVDRGSELGMFHFGGSTHCLVFRPQTKVTFFDENNTPGQLLRVNAAIAAVE